MRPPLKRSADPFRSFWRGYCSACNKFNCLGLWNFFTRDYTLLLPLALPPSSPPLHHPYWSGYMAHITAEEEPPQSSGVAVPEDAHFSKRRRWTSTLSVAAFANNNTTADTFCTSFIRMINGTCLLLLLLTCLWLCLIKANFLYIIKWVLSSLYFRCSGNGAYYLLSLSHSVRLSGWLAVHHQQPVLS